MIQPMDVEIPVTNEYGQQFHKAIRELAMKKTGLIGKKWKVIDRAFMSYHDTQIFEDDEIPWHHVIVKLFDGTDNHEVTLSKEEIEHHIDQRKLNAWQRGVESWS